MNNLFREYRKGDFDFVDPIDQVAADANARENAEYWVDRSPPHRSSTILDPLGVPLAVCNAVLVSQGVLELYSYVDKRVDQCAVRYGRAMRKIIERETARPDIHRLQLLVRADSQWAGRWANFLGFSFEGKLRSYGAQGEDHFLYAKVRA
jgi:hypothetical protein